MNEIDELRVGTLWMWQHHYYIVIERTNNNDVTMYQITSGSFFTWSEGELYGTTRLWADGRYKIIYNPED